MEFGEHRWIGPFEQVHIIRIFKAYYTYFISSIDLLGVDEASGFSKSVASSEDSSHR
jgi:hypothetical protein